MKVFLEYSDTNANALVEKYKDIVQKENNEEETFIAFAEQPNVPLSCEALLILEIASYIDGLATASGTTSTNPVYEQVKAIIMKNLDFNSALNVLVQHSRVLLDVSAEKEDHVEGTEFTSLLTLIQIINHDVGTQSKLACALADVLVSDSSKKQQQNIDVQHKLISTRIKLLAMLFNLLAADSPARCYVFGKLVVFCGESDNLDCIETQLNDTDGLSEWLKEWKATLAQERELYMKVIVSASQAENRMLLMKYMHLFFGTYQKAKPEELKDGQQNIIKVVSFIINLPGYDDIHQALLEYDCMKNLKQTNELKLLNIFVNEDVKAYESFYNKNKSLIDTMGLNHEINLHKMRLLTLVTISMGKTEISYHSVANELNIEESQVETWIIEAIGERLMEAKLDQMNSKVLIRRSNARGFNQCNWADLYERFNTWKQNVSEIIDVLDNNNGSLLNINQPVQISA